MTSSFQSAAALVACIAWLLPAVCFCGDQSANIETPSCCCSVPEAATPDGTTASVTAVCGEQASCGDLASLPFPGECCCAPEVETIATTTDLITLVGLPTAVVPIEFRVRAEAPVPTFSAVPARPARVLWNVWLC